MQVSFGSVIDTKIYLDGNRATSEQAKEITNLLCRNLRKDKTGAQHTPQTAEQRRTFENNVPDYRSIRGADVFFNKTHTASANVTSINIDGVGSGRFLVTGPDIKRLRQFGNDYNYNITRGRELIYDPEENYYYPSHQKEAARAYAQTVQGATTRHKSDLKYLFDAYGLGKTLIIEAKSMRPQKPEQMQLSLFSAASEVENAKKVPLHKRYTIQSLNFTV